MKKMILSVAAVIALSGCGSVEHRCPLTNKDGTCASMKETYGFAVDAAGGSGESIFHSGAAGQNGKGEGPWAGGDRAPSALGNAKSLKNVTTLEVDAGRHHLAGPVYTPARPYRIWVAPWTDANGIVHSGEHLFFVKPGHWNYGPMKAPGVAAGLLSPALPDDYGFEVEPEGGASEVGPGGFVRPADVMRGNAQPSSSRRRN